MIDDFRAEPLLGEDGGALLIVGGAPRGLGHGDLGELLLQRVRDDLVILDRVDSDLGGVSRIEEGVVGLRRRRRQGVVGSGDLGTVSAAAGTAGGAVEEGVQGLRRRRLRGVVGGGGLGTVCAVDGTAAAGSVEEVVEAPADDVDVQILVPQNHGRGLGGSIDEGQSKQSPRAIGTRRKSNRIVEISVAGRKSRRIGGLVGGTRLLLLGDEAPKPRAARRNRIELNWIELTMGTTGQRLGLDLEMRNQDQIFTEYYPPLA